MLLAAALVLGQIAAVVLRAVVDLDRWSQFFWGCLIGFGAWLVALRLSG